MRLHTSGLTFLTCITSVVAPPPLNENSKGSEKEAKRQVQMLQSMTSEIPEAFRELKSGFCQYCLARCQYITSPLDDELVDPGQSIDLTIGRKGIEVRISAPEFKFNPDPRRRESCLTLCNRHLTRSLYEGLSHWAINRMALDSAREPATTAKIWEATDRQHQESAWRREEFDDPAHKCPDPRGGPKPLGGPTDRGRGRGIPSRESGAGGEDQEGGKGVRGGEKSKPKGTGSLHAPPLPPRRLALPRHKQPVGPVSKSQAKERRVQSHYVRINQRESKGASSLFAQDTNYNQFELQAQATAGTTAIGNALGRVPWGSVLQGLKGVPIHAFGRWAGQW